MSSRTDQSDLVPGHHKCTEIPKRKAKVKCAWCNKTMLGNSFKTHRCITHIPKYMSYDIIGITSIASLFGKSSAVANPSSVRSQIIQDEDVIDIDDSQVGDEKDIFEEEFEGAFEDNDMPNSLEQDAGEIADIEPTIEEKFETTKVQNGADNESKDSGGQKRMRQPSLFESFGKLTQFENQIGDLIAEIQDKEQKMYLQKKHLR